MHNFYPRIERDYLRDREREILVFMASPMPVKQIIRMLGIKIQTYRAHANRVYQVLGVYSRTEAVCKAVGDGLIPLPRTYCTPAHDFIESHRPPCWRRAPRPSRQRGHR